MKQNTYKTVRETLTRQRIKQNTYKTVKETNATKNQTEHILNNALRLRQQTTKQNTHETVRETLT